MESIDIKSKDIINKLKNPIDYINSSDFYTFDYSKLSKKKNVSNKKEKEKEKEKEITLVDSLIASLSSNDNDRFNWVISQRKNINIEHTIANFNNDLLEGFLNKSIERFNTNIQNDLIYWIEIIFKKFFQSIPDHILNKLEVLLSKRTSNYNSLIELKSKISLFTDIKNSLLNVKSKEKNLLQNKNKLIEKPSLVYYESESEGEKEKSKKLKGTLKLESSIQKFKAKKQKERELKMEVDDEKEEKDDYDSLGEDEIIDDEELEEDDEDDFEDDE